MSCAAVLQSETSWLKLRDYDVVPLNAKLSSPIPELSNMLQRGVAACPDSSRDGFYSVELTKGWAYIHIHDHTQTVYLVAYSQN